MHPLRPHESQAPSEPFVKITGDELEQFVKVVPHRGTRFASSAKQFLVVVYSGTVGFDSGEVVVEGALCVL